MSDLTVKNNFTTMVLTLLAQKQSIEDLVAENLAKNPYSTGPQLVAMVNKTRENTTKQAVYTALKALMESEVVAKVGHTYFLSRVWLTKIESLFQAQKERELVPPPFNSSYITQETSRAPVSGETPTI